MPIKLKEGSPILLTYAEYVGYEDGVDDYTGLPFVELFFLSNQYLPSADIELEAIKFGNSSKSDAKQKSYNLKFKILQSQQHLTIGLETGASYFLEFCYVSGSLEGKTREFRSYNTTKLRSINKTLPSQYLAYHNLIVKASQAQSQAQAQAQTSQTAQPVGAK